MVQSYGGWIGLILVRPNVSNGAENLEGGIRHFLKFAWQPCWMAALHKFIFQERNCVFPAIQHSCKASVRASSQKNEKTT